MRRFIALGALVLAASIAEAADRPFFGLLHGHTSFSDGRGTPEEAYAAAKAAGLDFFAVTEHNHKEADGKDDAHDGIVLTPELYEKVKQAAAKATKDGQFVGLYGQEFSTISSGNHVNLINAPEHCTVPNGDFKTLYETWLPEHSETAFIQFNHPGLAEDLSPNTKPKERKNDYGLDDYHGSFPELVKASKPYVALIELIIGPAFNQAKVKQHQDGVHERDYLGYLNEGFRLGVSAGQDNHFKNWGTSTAARLGVWAPALTKDAILAALKARRTFATEDENLRVLFTANGVPMGSVAAPLADGTMPLSISINDPNEPNASYRVRLFYDDAVGGDVAKVIETVDVDGNQENVAFTHTPEIGGYYFVKVTQDVGSDNPDDVWTSPIWVAETAEVVSFDGTEPPVGDDVEKQRIDWSEAANYVGTEREVAGTIVLTKATPKILFLNFSDDPFTGMNVVIFQKDFAKFGGATALAKRVAGKRIVIKGTIQTFRDRPQIVLEKPEQLLAVE